MKLVISTYANILILLNKVKIVPEHIDLYSPILRVLASIQNATNIAENKLDEIGRQRELIKASLIKLHNILKNLEKNTENKDDKSIKSIKSINELIINLNKKLKDNLQEPEQIIEAVVKELRQNHDKVDQLLQQYNESLKILTEKSFVEVAEEMEKVGMKLTDSEKVEFRNSLSSPKSIKEKSENIAKKGIKLPNPDNTSDFTIVTYDAVISAMSRNLFKIDNKTVSNITKELAAIEKEAEASHKLLQSQKNESDKMEVEVVKLKNKLDSIVLLQIQDTNNQEKEITKIEAAIDIAKQKAPEPS